MTHKLLALACMAALTACSTIPSGPSALVLPAAQTSETRFRADESACRRFAHGQLLTSAHPPHSLEEGQLHFDISYLQCMYGKGHQIPVVGEVISSQSAWAAPTPTRERPPAGGD